MIKTTSIDSLTNFQKNAKAFIGRLEKSKAPMVLTVNGKAKLVIQNPQAYQEMVDQIEHARFIDAVKQGLEESKRSLGRPAKSVFAKLKAKHGL